MKEIEKKWCDDPETPQRPEPTPDFDGTLSDNSPIIHV
jgi:hypothetical protein